MSSTYSIFMMLLLAIASSVGISSIYQPPNVEAQPLSQAPITKERIEILKPITIDCSVLLLAVKEPCLGTPQYDKMGGRNLPFESIRSLGGDDYILGRLGVDYIFGGEGNDTIFGEAASDRLYGEKGADIIFGGPGDDHIYGNVLISDRNAPNGTRSVADRSIDMIDCGPGIDTVYLNLDVQKDKTANCEIVSSDININPWIKQFGNRPKQIK